MGYSQRVIFDFLIEREIKCKLKHWLEYDVHCASKCQFAFQQIGFLISRFATELTLKSAGRGRPWLIYINSCFLKIIYDENMSFLPAHSFL